MVSVGDSIEEEELAKEERLVDGLGGAFSSRSATNVGVPSGAYSIFGGTRNELGLSRDGEMEKARNSGSEAGVLKRPSKTSCTQ